MATQIWVSGAGGYWSTPSNWISGIPPGPRDIARISFGIPIIGQSSSIQGEAIFLGGEPAASSVVLAAIDTIFEPYTSGTSAFQTRLLVTGGHPVTSPLRARFIAEGNTSFEGQIVVEAVGGSLTINSASDGQNPGNFTLLNTGSETVVVVSQESFLFLQGQTITNGGLIQVDGGMQIDSSVTLAGAGSVALENGGHLMIRGTVAAGQQVNFADGSGSVTIEHADRFQGVLGFTTSGGDTIDLQGVVAQSDGFIVAATPPGILLLALYSGPDQSGSIVATLPVQMISELSLFPVQPNTLTAQDFVLSSDGNGGTLITYAPESATVLEQSLPVPVIGSPNQPVSLATILTQAFGTTALNVTKMWLLPTVQAQNTPGNSAYWSTTSNVTPQWWYDNKLVTQETLVTSIDQAQLILGNQIDYPVQFRVQTTPTASSTSGEYVTYDLWTVDPRIVANVQGKGFTGLPSANAIVASANAYADVYGLVPNNDLCNWIADNVAAGAGAPMPPANFFLDSADNESGGFWRIVYSGAQQPAPLTNWSSLVQPGDIVRMGWYHPENPTENAVTGHTTTVLGAVTKAMTITVYDNIDWVDGVEYIGVHDDVDYWVNTNPADITIYRLDSKQQYLIEGTSTAEQIQGSVFNDLILPGGGADSIAVGPGNNEIQGTIAELASISVIDFGPGDFLDFTDLALSTASVKYAGGALEVFSDKAQVASVTMPAPDQGDLFLLTSDGANGTEIRLVDPETQIELLYIGYLGRAGDPIGAQFWQNQLLANSDTKATLTAIATSFAVQPETAAVYPLLANPQQATRAQIVSFITTEYQELFGRAPDASGLAYWQSYLASNLSSPQAVGTFPLALIFGAVNSDLALDLTTITNKATVGGFLVTQFTAAHIDFGSAPSTANAFAHQILDQVDSTQDSVTAADASIMQFVHDHTELVGVQR